MKSNVRLYDLSQPIYHNCPEWPDNPMTQVSREQRTVKDGFNAETLTLNTHTATHIDTPFHFLDDGATVDKMPLDAFAGYATFIDLRHKEADSPITADDIAPFAETIQEDDIVILNTGWGQKREFTKAYLFEWPYLDKSGAELLLKARVKGVGIDGMSLGGWGSAEKGRPCHEVLLGAGLFIVEALRIPDEAMDGKRRWFSAFPLLLNDCGGSPVRAVLYDWE